MLKQLLNENNYSIKNYITIQDISESKKMEKNGTSTNIISYNYRGLPSNIELKPCLQVLLDNWYVDLLCLQKTYIKYNKFKLSQLDHDFHGSDASTYELSGVT